MDYCNRESGVVWRAVPYNKDISFAKLFRLFSPTNEFHSMDWQQLMFWCVANLRRAEHGRDDTWICIDWQFPWNSRLCRIRTLTHSHRPQKHLPRMCTHVRHTPPMHSSTDWIQSERSENKFNIPFTHWHSIRDVYLHEFTRVISSKTHTVARQPHWQHSQNGLIE